MLELHLHGGALGPASQGPKHGLQHMERNGMSQRVGCAAKYLSPQYLGNRGLSFLRLAWAMKKDPVTNRQVDVTGNTQLGVVYEEETRGRVWVGGECSRDAHPIIPPGGVLPVLSGTY